MRKQDYLSVNYLSVSIHSVYNTAVSIGVSSRFALDKYNYMIMPIDTLLSSYLKETVLCGSINRSQYMGVITTTYKGRTRDSDKPAISLLFR